MLNFKSFVGLSILTTIVGCSQQLMPTPNIYVDSTKDCFDSVCAERCNNRVEILYVTDRAPIKAKDGSLSYGTGRSDSLAYGNLTVEIGKNVSWQDLVKESRTASRTKGLSLSCGKPTELGRLPETPPPQVLVNGVVQDDPSAVSELKTDAQQFCSVLSKRLAAPNSKKEAYILVHGFNNSMDDAAFVMADLWHFLGRQGVPIIYTWPAGVGYAYDRESSEFTVFHLKQFLRGLTACKDLQKVHIIAHSRGTDVVMSALRELNIEYKSAGRAPGQELKLGNVVLAAADLDLKVARQRIMAEKLPFMPERLTVYSSTHDRALGAADILFKGGDRLGQISPSMLTAQQKANLEKTLQIQVVQAKVTKNFLGHDYFHSNPAVSSDLILLLRDNRSPGAENGRPLIKQMDNFWEVKDGYPNPAH